MLKKQSHISQSFSHIDSLKFSSFNYFGMGAVLASVTQSFWINFSAYYLNNILPSYGNIIFLLAQVFEGIGILIGWLLIARFQKIKNQTQDNSEKESAVSNFISRNCIDGINLYMFIYIIGAILLVTCLPMVFLLTHNSVYSIFSFSILAKIGSGLMIISQLTIIPKITLNRNRRRKLVQKTVQYGLAGTFLAMFIMTIVSTYVKFIWKYFFGVTGFVLFGSICSVLYIYKIRQLVVTNGSQLKQKAKQTQHKLGEATTPNIINWQILKSPKFFIYGVILICCTLYMDIIIAVYPYFIKSFKNITHFRYLTAITLLYFSSLVCSFMTKNVFVFSSIRILMTVGFASSIMATILLVLALSQGQFDSMMVIAMCLAGISKVIATNCALNLINELVGKEVKGKEFVYGFYYFFEKIIAGICLYMLISRVYVGEDIQFLQFSQIYLPFIFFSIAWVLVMIDRAISSKPERGGHIVIIQPDKQNKKHIQNDKSLQDDKKNPQRQKQFVNKEFDNHNHV